MNKINNISNRVLFCRYCANLDNLVRYWKELSRTIQTAGIGSKACRRRRNRVPSRSFSTLNRAESSYPVKSNRLLIKKRALCRQTVLHAVTVRYSEGRYSENFSSDNCDSGLGLGLGLWLGLGLGLDNNHWNNALRNSGLGQLDIRVSQVRTL